MTEAKVPEDRLTPEEMEELYADAEARHERDGDLDTLSIVCAVEAWRHERAEVRRLQRLAQTDAYDLADMRLTIIERDREIDRLREQVAALTAERDKYLDADERWDRQLVEALVVSGNRRRRAEAAEARLAEMRAALERIELASRYVPLEWRTSFVTTLGDIARNALNPADSAPAQEEA